MKSLSVFFDSEFFRTQQRIKREIRALGEEEKLRQQTTETREQGSSRSILNQSESQETVAGLTRLEIKDLKLYLERWDGLQSANVNNLSYDDIPWPPSMSSGLLYSLALLNALNNTNPPIGASQLMNEVSPLEIKTIFRKESLKWHPDKFMTQMGKKIQSKDLLEVMKRVTETSQSLNQEYTKFKDL
eukprot:g5572.t1